MHVHVHEVIRTIILLSFYQTISLMQACVDVSFPYAHVRDAFGKKIGEHQVILSNA